VSSQLGGGDRLDLTRVAPVPDATHIGEARRAVGALASQLGFDEEATGRVAIVATELATNIAKHGGGGQLLARPIAAGRGIEVIAVDKGRGISDIDRAMRDGYSSGGTAGKGLGAVRRMSDAFDVYSQPGRGTAVFCRMLLSLATVEPSAADALELGVVCVPAPNETVSGDSWIVVQGNNGPIVVIVDGLGHGDPASTAASAAIVSCRRAVGATPVSLIETMHRALGSTRGAAAAAAEIDTTAKCVRFVGVGNISCSVVDSAGSRSLASMSGIVGHKMPRVREFTTPFTASSSLVMFSDGLTSRWRIDDYPGLRPRHPALAAGVAFRDHLRGRDDATVIVARMRSGGAS
jgi:anti-sigma regulatory factor (Ser/Thr protein kinase)